jgi:hypothetical protein
MQPLTKEYPNLEFRVHWLREQMGLPNGKLRGTVRPTQQGGDRINVREHGVRMAIGDDMTMVFDPTSQKGITVFDKDGNVLKTYEPEGSQTSRDVLIDLLTGKRKP